jgi:Fe-Mn family superoxide dismutase
LGGVCAPPRAASFDKEEVMSFTLPDLPYAHDALAPYMSRETLEYHHDKHHLAYVNNGNNLLKGTEW